MKEHVHTFVNTGGHTGALDFRFPVGAPVSGLQAFARTEQLGWGDKAANALRLGTSPIVRALVDFDGGMDMVRDLDDITFTEWFTSFGGSRGSIERMWDPIAYALGFLDCDHISARCMLTIFMLFAIRTEASVLRMLDGSPQTFLHDPIVNYLEERGVRIHLRTGIRDIVCVLPRRRRGRGDAGTWRRDVAAPRPRRGEVVVETTPRPRRGEGLRRRRRGRDAALSEATGTRRAPTACRPR